MKTVAKVRTVLFLAVIGMATNGWAQGSLTPPGAPVATMKTLEEIWNQITQLQAQMAATSNRVAALTAAQFPAIAAPLRVGVDTNGALSAYTSLAFSPLGRPAISYSDNGNDDLKYAAWNGSSWAIQTVDSVGEVGIYPSLAFHPPSGNPAISYWCWEGSVSILKYTEIIQAP